VIIIVLTLLSTMVFLGFFFFGFTDQAQLAARSYAEADDADGLLNPEGPFNLAFEQLIVGTKSQYEESALWGGRHSILSHIVGPIDGNLRPMMDSMYAGGGMQMVEADESGDGIVDCYAMDYTGDGIADDLNTDTVPDYIAYRFNQTGARTYTPANRFVLNFSRVAQFPQYREDAFDSLNGAVTPSIPIPASLNPAAGYTYPDLNSLFLASDTTVTINDAGTSTDGTVKVVIPSFFRPQLLMSERQTGDNSTLFTGANTRFMSLRPHQLHRNLSGNPRYLQTPTTAQSGDTSRLLRPFPFNQDRDRNTVVNEYGIFSYIDDSVRDNASAPSPRSTHYEYDVDNDGDGTTDSIWMDLGLPMIDLTDGRQVVPLVAFKVVDADGLFNVNVHGNLTGLYYNTDPTNDTAYIDANSNGMKDAGELTFPFHRSNMGLGPSEINLSYGLFDDVANAAPIVRLGTADQNRLLNEYGNSGVVTVAELSNLAPANSERHAVAALEAMYLLTGRVPYRDEQPLAGRHGETNVLLSFFSGSSVTPPRAGRTIPTPPPAVLNYFDDDGDYQTSGGLGYFASKDLIDYSTGLPVRATISTPPGVHPLPLNGGGIGYLSSGAAGAARTLRNPITDNPAAWPNYTPVNPSNPGKVPHWHDQNAPNAGPTTGTRPYSQAGGTPGDLQVTGVLSTVDEDDEVVAHSSYPNAADSPYPASENAGLQLSNRDFALSGESSRLRQLAPFNLNDSPTADGYVDGNSGINVNGHSGAEANRKMFTTDSWDRNELAMFPKGRSWEFNLWLASDTVGTFPPKFGTINNNFLLSAPYVPQGTLDPFRYELRRLLATTLGGYDVNAPNYEEARIRPQMPLNINRVLTGFDSKGNPMFRELTPHPTFLATETVALPASAPPYSSIGTDTPPANLPGRINAEWWARNDRQNMARDIFTLLWTLSGGKDGSDYTTSAGILADLPPSMPPVEDPATAGREDDHYDTANGNVQAQIEARDRVREMAQFAVNVVDALDRDNVITEFRYDENLIDGWDVSTTYESVYGVEAAQLTLSEVLAIRTPKTGGMTSYDAMIEYESNTTERYHLFVELRNASPFNVSIQNEEWRIRRVRAGAAALPERFATLRDTVFTSPGGTAGHIGPGDVYVIGSQDGGNRFAANQYRPSDFRVDRDPSPGFELIVPNLDDVGPAPTTSSTFTDYPVTLCDLDLFANSALPNGSHVGRYSPNTVNAAPTAQFTETDSLLNAADVDIELGVGDGVIDTVTLVLERRLHNSGVDITDGAGIPVNPWIEVDRMPDVRVQVFNITTGGMMPVDDLLDDLKSVERREPFSPRTNLYAPPTAPVPNVWQQHTIPRIVKGTAQERNSAVPVGGSFSYWQPHFDRDFASVMDLLSIPLYGYSRATANSLGVYDQRLDRNSAGVDNLTGEARMFRVGGPTKNLVDLNGDMSGHRTASVRFLHPESTPGTNLLDLATNSTGYDGVLPSPRVEVQKHYRNRWYRLLQFLTVPDRSDEQAKQLVTFNGRTPGKLNLNTIRHEHVMAGLLDDPIHMNALAYPGSAAQPIGLTQDPIEPWPYPAPPPGQIPRNWFREMMGFRDQADPILGVSPITTGISIPGNVNSVPYRPLGHLDSTSDLSITQTILRSRISAADTTSPPDNVIDTEPHGLFEARAAADVGANAIDFHSRNRLLAKIHNRTTTRSNVFFVWATIGFFDAHQPPFAGGPGYVTIGAQAEDLPMRRAFAVVDMTRLEEAYDDPNSNDNVPGTFDFRKFIIYRKTIK
jgi:hypothetical protein